MADTSSKKTILIPILVGTEAKNVLRTGIYGTLRLADTRLVFLVRSEYQAEYYRREFSADGVVFDVLPRLRPNSFEKFFSRLKLYLLRTETIDFHRRTHYEESGNWLRFWSSWFFNRLAARASVRRFVRFLDTRFSSLGDMGSVFEKYKPDLLFTADLFNDAEIALLREAKKRTVRSVGLINTWDRVTSRWMIRILPDFFIVFNEIVKRELAKYADMPTAKIFVSGTVQHDHLVTGEKSSRSDFCKRVGIPEDARIIVYCPLGDAFDKGKPEIDRGLIRILSNWIKEGAFGGEKFFLLVRFHPNDRIEPDDWEKLPNVVYDMPGLKFAAGLSDQRYSRTRGQNWDMTFDDLRHLHDTLAYAATIICYYTSLSIDAAVVGKPVININFNIRNGKIVAEKHFYYGTTHYKNVVPTGGVRLVESEEELRRALATYLENPENDKVGREWLVKEQCYKIDGLSGKRAATIVLSLIKSP